MNDEKLIKIVGIILVILIISLAICIIIPFNKKKQNENNKQDVYSENVNVEEHEVINSIENSNDVGNNEPIDYEPTNLIGILKIPKINIEAEIMEGTDESVLANYIGHFQNTSTWNGNVALASHNNGESVSHYFENINQLIEGDEIIYITNLGERRYTVFSVREISDTDWSITEATTENILTLMTCITGSPEKRLCVQAREIL